MWHGMVMNSTLSFEYQFNSDGDDLGSLIARVETPDFSGWNSMWVQWQDIRDFASSLSSFPIEANSPLKCEWGFDKNGEYTQVTVVKIAPTGTTGALVADVYLANFYAPENRCQTLFDTDYPSLERFKNQIERMMCNRCGTATLEGMKTNFR
jgi:hypothetical protein